MAFRLEGTFSLKDNASGVARNIRASLLGVEKTAINAQTALNNQNSVAARVKSVGTPRSGGQAQGFQKPISIPQASVKPVAPNRVSIPLGQPKAFAPQQQVLKSNVQKLAPSRYVLPKPLVQKIQQQFSSVGGQQAIASQAKLKNNVSQTSTTVQAQSNIFTRAKTGLQAWAFAGQSAAKGAKTVGQAIKELPDDLKTTNTALNDLRLMALQAGVGVDKLATSSLNAAGKLVDAKNKFLQVSGAVGKTNSNAAKVGGYQRLISSLKGTGNAARDVGSRMRDAWRTSAEGLGKLTSSIFNLQNFILAGGITLGVKSVVDAVGFKEQELTSYGVIFKDLTKAANGFRFAVKFAAETPFETPEVVTSIRQLAAYQFQAKNIPGMLRNIGDAASATTDRVGGMASIIRALGQIKAKGRVQTEELLQIEELGINIRGSLEKAFTRGDKKMFRKYLEGGLIGAEDAIPVIIKAFGNQFGGMMKKQSKTIFGLVSTIKSRPFELFSSLDADKEFAPFKKLLDNIGQVTDFENNPIGKKIKSRFMKSVGGLFKNVFGFAADNADPEAIGKAINKAFDQFDGIVAWIKKNGPTIISESKNFFVGLRDTIYTVKSAFDWIIGAGEKVAGSINTVAGAIKKIPGLDGVAKTLGGGKTSGSQVLGMAAGALATGAALKTVDGLLLGLPGKAIKFTSKLAGRGIVAGTKALIRTALPKVAAQAAPRATGVIARAPGLLARGAGLIGRVSGAVGRGVGGFLGRGAGLLARAPGVLGRSVGGFAARGAGLIGRIPLAGLARGGGMVLSKLAAPLAALTTGMAIGELVRKIPTGKGRNVDSSLTDFFADNLFGGNNSKAQMIAADAQLSSLKAIIAKRQAAQSNSSVKNTITNPQVKTQTPQTPDTQKLASSIKQLNKLGADSSVSLTKNFSQSLSNVRSVPAKIVAAFTDLPAKIRAALGGTGKVFDDAGDQIFKAVYTPGVIEKMKTLGHDVGLGFNQGVNNQTDGAFGSGAALGNAAKFGVQTSTQTHSPSRVLKLVGNDVGTGFKLGILEKYAEVRKAGQTLGNASRPKIAPIQLQTKRLERLDSRQNNPTTSSVPKTVIQTNQVRPNAPKAVVSFKDGAVQINIHPTPNQNPKEIGLEVRRELAAWMLELQLELGGA